ncbi:MAG: hypothetical protein LBI34_00205 [Puniceicoccales bacterium]|nr:hypothetical protein [Puniceicoccales bacterium]
MTIPAVQTYPYLSSVVDQVKASPNKSPMASVRSDPVNVHQVLGRLSWTGFFTHIKILVEVGVYANLFFAFVGEFFSCSGSRRLDVYTHILSAAGFVVDCSVPDGYELARFARKQPQRIKNLLAKIDQKMAPVPAEQLKDRQPSIHTPTPDAAPPSTAIPEQSLQEQSSPVSAPAGTPAPEQTLPQPDKSLVQEQPPQEQPSPVSSTADIQPSEQMLPQVDGSLVQEPVTPESTPFETEISPLAPTDPHSPMDLGDLVAATSLEFCECDEVEGVITFKDHNDKMLKVSCPDGALDLSECPNLRSLEIQHCMSVRGVKLPSNNSALEEVVIVGCKNLSGSLDFSSCVDICSVVIDDVGEIRISIPDSETFALLYVKNCKDLYVFAPNRVRTTSTVEMEFEACEFRQGALNEMQTLREYCKSVKGLPRPQASIGVRIPKAPPRVVAPAAKDIRPATVVRAVPVGIKNLSASCYAASLMQLLFQNRQFREAIAGICEIIPAGTELEKLARAINDIFKHLQSGDGACPKSIMHNFLQLEETLGFAQAFQQDDPTLLLRDIVANLDKLSRRTQVPEISSLIAATFPSYQRYKSVESLTQPKHVYSNFRFGEVERFDDIKVSPDDGCLEAAFEKQFGVHDLSQEEQSRYQIDPGVACVSITKIGGEPPPRFTVHIGRVHFKDGRVHKDESYFSFPERIEMRQHTTNSSGLPCVLELNAVVAHSGTANGGHYISFVKRGDQWYECNDSRVRKVSWDDMKKLFDGTGGFHATMLSYARAG